MEGKGVLFKRFADIDVFDIEVAENDPDRLIEIIASLEPTFGGINLEDIKAPECFYIEEKLRERMNIPVFHDDQHGTAIAINAALINALEIQQKNIQNITNFYIPGFNRTYDSSGLGAGFSYTVSYLIPIVKK